MNKLGMLGVVVVSVIAGAFAAEFAQNMGSDDEMPVVDTAAAVQQPHSQTSASEQASDNQATKKSSPEQRLSEVDRALPTFELLELDDSVWNAESLQGKPWVINFWATWCPPCIEEIPSMNAAYEFLEPKGVGMLAINAGEGAIAVETFFDKIAIDFPNIMGDADSLPNWSIRALPTTIVVDATGKIVFEALGPREWDDEQLLQRVVDLL